MANYSLEKRSRIVRELVKLYPTPDQSVCPLVKIYWRGKNKELGEYTKVYYPCENGKLFVNDTNAYKHPYRWGNGFYYDKPDTNGNNYVVSSATKNIRATYAKYYPEFECIEIAMITMPANRGVDGEVRTWNYNNKLSWYHRLFLFYGQVEPFDETGNVYMPEGMGRYYNKKFVDTLNWYSREGNDSTVMSEEIKKFVKGATLNKAYWHRDVDCLWTFAEWYKQMAPRKQSVNAKKLDAIELPDIAAEITKKYPIRCIPDRDGCHWRDKYYNDTIIAFRKTCEDEGVFRIFFKREYDGKLDHEEKYRIFVNRKGAPTLMEPNGEGTWRISSAKVGNRIYGRNSVIKDGWDDMSDVLHLKYIKQMVEDIEAENRAAGKETNSTIELIVDLLRHPIVEKLWKSGYHDLAKAIREDGNITASVKELFNGKEKKTGSLTEILGVNKYQLKKLNEIAGTARDSMYNRYNRRNNLFKLIPNVKFIMGTDNISSLSNETTDKYFTAVREMNEVTNWPKYFLYQVNDNGQPFRPWHWSHAEDTPLTEEEKRRLNRIIRLGSKNKEAYRIFSDVVGTYCTLNEDFRPDIKIYEVDTFDELMHVHDSLNTLLSQQRVEERKLNALKEDERNRIREEKMKGLQDKRIKRYEEVGDDFAIIVPRHLSQLVTEGMTLSHCVGGYCETVATGSTDILFLRKSRDMMTPFYTMEVHNGQLIQIHGFANKWLGNNPEAISFVKQWLDSHNIRYRREQLLDKSLHYMPCGDLVDGAAYGL